MGAAGDLGAVEEEHEALVGGDVETQGRGAFRRLEAEPEAQELALRRWGGRGIRRPDPRSGVQGLKHVHPGVSAKETLGAENANGSRRLIAGCGSVGLGHCAYRRSLLFRGIDESPRLGLADFLASYAVRNRL